MSIPMSTQELQEITDEQIRALHRYSLKLIEEGSMGSAIDTAHTLIVYMRFKQKHFIYPNSPSPPESPFPDFIPSKYPIPESPPD